VDRVRNFWQQISEGRQIDELWSQFTADARASYGFYMKEVDSKRLEPIAGSTAGSGLPRRSFWSLFDEDDAGAASPVARGVCDAGDVWTQRF